MSCGGTWGEEENKFLIDMWSDDVIEGTVSVPVYV